MRFVDLIEKKKEGRPLSAEEIQYWIRGYVNGDIPDYQVSALLMAILFKGMNPDETLEMTMCMMHSGDVMDLSAIHGLKADKHSTGGVGDKTSLVLGPMVAACGVPMAKMSGRGLGFTGGTLDKLESIEGFRVNLDRKDFVSQVNRIGIAIVGQSGNLVPADKKLYALRDVTGTVNSIPLIASSIMSKKLAAGSDVIVLDVKYGSGAFMKTPEDAVKLAQTMIQIGTGMGRKVRAVISSMEAPLGRAVGNALEVEEAVRTLQGRGPEDLIDLCMAAGSLILQEAGGASSASEAEHRLSEALKSGRALNKLADMVEAQGGSRYQILHPEMLPTARYKTDITSDCCGYVHGEEAMELGSLAMRIGAGRAKKEDEIWNEVGIVLKKKPGDYVQKGETLAVVHHRMPLTDEWKNNCRQAFVIDREAPEDRKLIYEII
ncbi:MAG: pyrimidine-nucleoside phosphorylase [Coprococcus sp.]